MASKRLKAQKAKEDKEAFQLTKMLTKKKYLKRPKRKKNKIAIDTFGTFSAQSDEIVTFCNAEESQEYGTMAGNNVFSSGDGTQNTDIHKFFARPVRIDDFTWNESAVYGSTVRTMDPWSAWANNQAVKDKLNNYAWFRGDLKVKIQITASPFYYGLLKMCYQPLPNFKADTISIDIGTRYLISFSQRPHVDLLVGENDSFNTTLPFIFPANWVNVQKATSFAELGRLKYLVYSQLASANGVSGVGIGVTVYAWVDNIELSGASVGFSMQSGENDEFGQGVISQPASWVATAASYLEDIPIIGPFATATRIGASAISAIASMFGFTNVPVIADTIPQRPEAFPKLASAEIGFPVERISLDPKNELSVDPRIVGLSSGIDEMSIQYISSRESFLTSATWTTANLIDDMLFYSLVNPCLFDAENTTNSAIYMTPMSWVAKAFRDWRGSIIFRFHIVASKYHKGKLRISFDPSGYAARNLGNLASTSNIVHTAIIDIGETQNVEFHVPYQQALQFLVARNVYTASNIYWNVNTALTTFSYDGDYDNGYLTLRVMNPLTAPETSSTVRVLVYVRAGDDIEFANPTPIDTGGRLTNFAPQSLEMNDEGSDAIVLGPTKSLPEKQYLVHYGENIRSLRQLLHRYELSSIEVIDQSSVAADQSGDFLKHFYKMPRSPGYTTDSTVTAYKQGSVVLSYGYNFVNMTLLNWLQSGYLMYRGSINWSFDVDAPFDVGHLRLYKTNDVSLSARVQSTNIPIASTNQKNALVIQMRNSGGAGSAATNQKTQAVLNVQAPNYSRYKFQSTQPSFANTGSTKDGSNLDAFVLQGAFPTPLPATKTSVTVTTYNATGIDFGLYFFLNVPTFWLNSGAPVPTP